MHIKQAFFLVGGIMWLYGIHERPRNDFRELVANNWMCSMSLTSQVLVRALIYTTIRCAATDAATDAVTSKASPATVDCSSGTS